MMNTRHCALDRVLICALSQVANTVKMSLVVVAVSLGSLSNATADWTGGVEGGTVINNDGGSATRLRLKLNNDTKPLSHYVYADWLRADIGSSYELGYKPRYWFSEALYVFGEARARQDKPRFIDRELFGLTGVGVQFISNEQRSLFAELGAGLRKTEFENELEDSDTTAIARAGFKQILGDLISLELDADTNVSDTISASNAEAGIALRVPGGALKYSYRTQRFEFENQSAVTTSDSYISFSYGF